MDNNNNNNNGNGNSSYNDQQLRELMDAAEIASMEDAAAEGFTDPNKNERNMEDSRDGETIPPPPPLLSPQALRDEEGGICYAPMPKKMRPSPPVDLPESASFSPIKAKRGKGRDRGRCERRGRGRGRGRGKGRRGKDVESDSDYEAQNEGGEDEDEDLEDLEDDGDETDDWYESKSKRKGSRGSTKSTPRKQKPRQRKQQSAPATDTVVPPPPLPQPIQAQFSSSLLTMSENEKRKAAESNRKIIEGLEGLEGLNIAFDEGKLLSLPGSNTTGEGENDDDDDNDNDDDDDDEEVEVGEGGGDDDDGDDDDGGESYDDDRLECENAMELGGDDNEGRRTRRSSGRKRRGRGSGRGRGGRGGGGGRRLSSRAKGLNEEQSKKMGQANLLFTSGKFSEAVKILLELIKQAPKAPDPYNTLGLIHEEINQQRKALKFYKIAALFNPKKPLRWKSLAQMAMGIHEYDDADYCLGKAATGLPEDPEPLMERAKLNVFLIENEPYTEDEKLDRHKKTIGYLKALVQLLEKKVAGSVVTGVAPSVSPLPESIGASQKRLSQSQSQSQPQSQPQPQPQTANKGKSKERVSPETARQREEMLREAQIMLSKEFYATGSLKEAVAVLQGLYDKQVQALRGTSDIYRPEDYDMTRIFELINMLSELYLELGEFEKAITLITSTKAGLKEGESLPLELVVNYGICKAYLGDMNEAFSALSQLFSESVEDYGDLFYNVAEAFLAIGEFAHACSVFAILCRYSAWDIPSIWLKVAQAHRSEGNLTEAARLFERVLAAVPINVYSVVALYEIYQSTGNKARACTVLDNFLTACRTSTDPDNIISRKELTKIRESKIRLLYELNRIDEFVVESLRLISDCRSGSLDVCFPQRRRHRRTQQTQQQQQQQSTTTLPAFVPDDPGTDNQSQGPHNIQEEEDNNDTTSDGEEGEKLPALLPLLRVLEPPKFFGFILRICRVLSGLGRNTEAAGIAEAGNECSRMCRPESTDGITKLKKLTVEIFYRLGQYQVAFDKIRPLCIAEPENSALWSMLDEILIKSKMYYRDKPQKVLVRLLQKHPNNFALIMLVAHHCLVSGVHSVEEYTNALCINPDDPLANLCIGISLLLKSASRRVTDKNYAIIKGFAFLYKYARLRGQQSQEVLYNLARAYQQLGIVHIAEKLYLEALKPVPMEHNMQRPPESLRMEAAYNLSYLYKQSGSYALAKSIIETYCTI